MQSITTVTMNPTLDKSSSIEQVVPERKLRCQTLRREPGGGGINVARAIYKLGGQSKALYPAGGPPGQILQQLLDEEGLDHRAMLIEDWTRESLVVLEEATDQQYRFNLPGPTLDKSEWQQCLENLAKSAVEANYLVASGSLPPGVPDDFYARLARKAKENDSRFVLDTSTKAALRLAGQEGVYLIKPNLREFRELIGSELAEEADQEAAARDIIEKGQSQVVVVSLGAAGVILATETGVERLRAPTVSIRSKVGAGDSTVAGIVLGLARGKALREAVRFGVAAGAAAVMTPGTQLCRLEDTERLYESIT
jgi:6-phosphofructokinase 2